MLSRAEEAAGGVGYWMRQVASEEVEPHYQRSLELARRAGDRRQEAWALYNLAFVYDFVGMSLARLSDPERAMAMRMEALAIFREIDDRRGIGESLWALGGNTAVISHDPVTARTYLAEATRILVETGNTAGAAWASSSLGFLEALAGNLDAAREAILDAAALFHEDGDVSGLMITFKSLATLAALSGDDRLAARLLAVSDAIASRAGIDPPVISILDEPLDAARDRLSAEDMAAETAAAAAIEPRAYVEALLAKRVGSAAPA